MERCEASQLYGFFYKAALIMAAAFFICALAASALFTCRVEIDFAGQNDERVLIERGSVMIALLLLAAFAFFCRFFGRKAAVTDKAYRLLRTALIVLTIVGGLVWIFSAKAYPTHDSLSCLELGDALAGGGKDRFASSSYIRIFPFQSGLILWDALFCLIFGKNAVTALQIANVFLLAGSKLLLLDCTDKLFGSRTVSALAAILLLLFVQPVFLTTFVYGVLPGLFFALLGFRLLLCCSGIGYVLTGGICLAISCMLKQNYLVFVIAVAAAMCLDALKKRSGRVLLAAIAAALPAFLMRSLPQIVLEGLTGYAFGPGTPQGAWLVTGFRESSLCSGWFNSYTTEILMRNGYDAEKAAATIRGDFAERLSEFAARPRYAVSFFGKKFISQWCEPTFQSIWSAAVQNRSGEVSPIVESLFYGAGAELYAGFCAPVVRLIYGGFAGGCLGLLASGKNRETTPLHDNGAFSEAALLVLPLFALGTGLYHMLFEAKAQYVLPAVLCMIPYAASLFCSLGKRASSCGGSGDTAETEQDTEQIAERESEI